MFDVVLSNGLVIDGTGQKPFEASIGIRDNKIAAISKNILIGKLQLDIGGKAVSPGFIDIHSHSDCSFFNEGTLDSKLYQGVTTEFVGNCGISMVPNNERYLSLLKRYVEPLLVGSNSIGWNFSSIREYADELRKKSFPINCAPLLGHGALRICVMGFNNRPAKKDEIKKMQILLEKELLNGAWGMSMGLVYPPGSFSRTDELMGLAKVIADYKAILSVHIRNEGNDVFNALSEVIEVGKKARAHIHISHLKLIGNRNWGKAKELLLYIKRARDEGVKITCDQYPYSASATYLSTLIPSWAQEGGVEEMLVTIRGSKRKEVISYIEKEILNRGGSKKIAFSYSTGDFPQEWEGKNIEQISNLENLDPPQVILKILDTTKGRAMAIYYSMCDEDVEEILKDTSIAVCSDGYALGFDDNKCIIGKPHPRNFGTFPRFLKLARKKNIMPIEQAIYKITSLPAKIMKLNDRGLIKMDNIADLVVFDLVNIADTSTYEEPYAKPVGIEHLLIEGKPVILKGRKTHVNPGQVLLRC